VKGEEKRIGFRFLLWWGSETMQAFVNRRRPKSIIQYVSHTHRRFPVSAWIFEGASESFVMFSGSHRQMRIIRMPGLNCN